MNTFLVTGASSDIACAYLRFLNEKHEEVLVLGQYNRSGDKLKETVKELKHIEIIPYQCDLSDEKQTINWLSDVSRSGYSVDHILHIAAPTYSYMRIKQFDWNKVIQELTVQVNTFGQLLKTFTPAMVKAKHGKIVAVISSITFCVPPKFISHYILTKYALLGLVRAAASEYAGKNIQINGISPTMIETKFLTNLDERVVEITAQNAAMKRNLKPEEVAPSIDYLMSDSNICSGINLNLSGGDCM